MMACGGESDRVAPQTDQPDVAIATFAFTPKTFTVELGTSVTWRNDDDILHTVTSGRPRKQGVPGVTPDVDARPDGLFDRDLELDDTFDYEFTERGEYSYYCDIHSGMRGKIIVN